MDTYRAGTCSSSNDGYTCLRCSNATCTSDENRVGSCGGVAFPTRNEFTCRKQTTTTATTTTVAPPRNDCIKILTGALTYDDGDLTVWIDFGSGKGMEKIKPSARYARNASVLEECYAKLQAVQIRCESKNTWAGTILFATDKKTFRSGYCDTCQQAGSTDRTFADGDDSARKVIRGTAGCWGGKKCLIQPTNAAVTSLPATGWLAYLGEGTCRTTDGQNHPSYYENHQVGIGECRVACFNDPNCQHYSVCHGCSWSHPSVHKAGTEGCQLYSTHATQAQTPEGWTFVNKITDIYANTNGIVQRAASWYQGAFFGEVNTTACAGAQQAVQRTMDAEKCKDAAARLGIKGFEEGSWPESPKGCFDEVSGLRRPQAFFNNHATGSSHIHQRPMCVDAAYNKNYDQSRRKSECYAKRLAGGVVEMQDKEGGVCSANDQCSRCRGNCDRDADCYGTLKCFVRDAANSQVPGCSEGSQLSRDTLSLLATGSALHNYCYDPSSERECLISTTYINAVHLGDTGTYCRVTSIYKFLPMLKTPHWLFCFW